ncbi:hypothetical protein D0469_09690 [Peribacillus saganii]|uniref:Flagellin C-terminal domain-containing protein n=2 Tax=Peribacillus saganii TaxID=2303992 RepID=A0A372LQX6_9BACI|nr:hypothetical protein D0469_09690 [Peribacillus saganii]
MADNETVSMDFNVTNNVERTVQVKDSSNNSVTGMFVLDNTGSTEITGTGLKLNFDPSTIANGTIGFNVDDITPNDFKMTLKEDTDGDGLFESTVVNAQSFNKGDLVSLGATGINVQTSNSTSVSDSALFEIENVAQDNSATMQIGANAGQTVSLELKDMRAKALQISTDLAGGGEQTLTLLNGSSQTVWFTEIAGVNDGVSNNSTQYALDISTNEKAQAAIIAADDAIQRVSEERSRMGALQNRLEYTVDNLKYMNENLTASESRIRDLDMAEEMTKFTKNNILNQAAQAMLAQANQLPQGVLQLLK